MKRNPLNLLPLLGLLLVPGLVNAQDTNAPAVAATNAAPSAIAQPNATASAADEVSPALKAAVAARAVITPSAPITPITSPASKALAFSNANDDVNPALKALAANAGPLTDFSTLVAKLSQRNIFNPYRVKNVPYTNTVVRTRQVISEWFSLQGTSRNDDVWAAFFDGTSSQYRRTLQTGDTIAGYTIAEIAADYIMLAAASNKTVKLPMQAQMKRTGAGPWSVGRSAYNPMASESSGDAALIDTVTNDSGGGGAATDALRRLMAKRLKDE